MAEISRQTVGVERESFLWGRTPDIFSGARFVTPMVIFLTQLFYGGALFMVVEPPFPILAWLRIPQRNTSHHSRAEKFTP